MPAFGQMRVADMTSNSHFVGQDTRTESGVIVRNGTTVGDAIRAIESSKVQTAFVVDGDHVLLGIVTNGDVRRFLIDGGNIESAVEPALNRDFKAVRVDAPREESLKLFDMGYTVVPRLDHQGHLVDLLTPDHHHRDFEIAGRTIVRARAPARISFAGGGTDLTYFFSRYDGLVLNAAISRYAITTLIPRESFEIDIYSHDLGSHQHFVSSRAMIEASGHNLLSTTASLIKPDFGFEMHVSAEFPIGSGLGGSSAVVTSILTAFNELRADRWSPYEVAELAFQAERLCFKVPGGWQDQYVACFGGFNLIQFTPTGNSVNPLRVPDDVICELEESLILFDTGLEHDSGDLHTTQKKEMSNLEGDEKLSRLTQFCQEMNRALARQDLRRFGEGLHQAWLLKKQTSSRVSSEKIDQIYAAALSAGALGGKLLGAGGGGYILFFVPPDVHSAVVAALRPFDCKPSRVRFDIKGARSWRTRIP
jgi:D-glycero-alpha-D-manno-heptose-7-phosphate kinase